MTNPETPKVPLAEALDKAKDGQEWGQILLGALHDAAWEGDDDE